MLVQAEPGELAIELLAVRGAGNPRAVRAARVAGGGDPRLSGVEAGCDRGAQARRLRDGDHVSLRLAEPLVAAHDHSMQRLAARQGITTLISGAGGRALYPLDQQDPRLRFGNNTDYGALRLRLRPGVAEYQFRSLDGAELDSGRVRCEQG